LVVELPGHKNEAKVGANSGEKQFWLRVLLFAGLLWGTSVLIKIPFIIRDEHDSWFTVFVAVLNGLTILPATALAFWHRRIACIWLSLDVVLVIVAMILYRHQGAHIDPGEFIGLSITFALAVCLNWYELRRWPMALDPR
jgi:hypothetical protein